MPEKSIVTYSKSAVACATLLVTLLLGSSAHAQMPPRLDQHRAMIDRGGGDPAREDQIRRYQDSASKQQAELDRVTLQARRMGCESSGFFSLFNGQNAQCGPVNNQIQQML